MRVLHVTHQYRPAIGGAEQHITDLSEALAARGHQVDVFTSRSLDYHTWKNDLPRYERLNGVNVYRFDSLPRTPLVWKLLTYGLNGYWRTESRWYEPFIFLGNGPVSVMQFAALLRRVQRYDLVHINNLHYAHAWLAYVAARWRGVPVVITPHLHIEQRETYDVHYMKNILCGCQALIADTIAERDFMDQQGWNTGLAVGGVGLALDRFPPLNRQQSRAQFGLPEKGTVILFLGRKTDYKGVDLCVEAFRQLRQERTDVYFLAVGPETKFSRALWPRYAGLEGLVIHDTVSDEERLTALAACDVLALPSTAEAFGIVYLEAWAYHKPVIGARIASVASFVDESKTGWLVEPRSINDLTHAFRRVVEQPAQARAVGERGWNKLCRRYTVERIAAIVEGVYARVLRHWHTIREV